MITSRRARISGVAVIGLAVALSGCSQIAAIAPVGGTRLAEVRYAANIVLVNEGIEILAAPVCTSPDDIAVSCRGESVVGEAIQVESTAASPSDVTIAVADRTLYDGSLLAVLEKGSSE